MGITNLKICGNPDNQINYINRDQTDEIIIGASAHHMFRLLFNYDLIEDFEITYAQSIEDRDWLIKNKPWCIKNKSSEGITVVSDNCGGTLIYVDLTPYETSSFKLHRTTVAQIKIWFKSGEVIIGDKNKIIVKGSLSPYSAIND